MPTPAGSGCSAARVSSFAGLSPQSALTQVEFAKALIANEENEKAASVLRRALDLAPSSLDAKYQLALALQASGPGAAGHTVTSGSHLCRSA